MAKEIKTREPVYNIDFSKREEQGAGPERMRVMGRPWKDDRGFNTKL